MRLRTVYLSIPVFACLLSFSAKAQNVGINSSGAAPATSAGLDVDFSNKGLLIPRVALSSTTDVSTIASPANALLVYNTSNTGNVTPGFYYYSTTSTAWIRMSTQWATSGSNVSYSGGNVGVGTSTFNSTNPEKLLVDAGTTSSYNVISGKGTINNYLQLNIQNKSNGTSASSDVVATNDSGTETANYVNMGINSSGNTSTGILGGANTAYLYGTGGDMVIGNASSGNDVKIFTNGTASTDEKMRVTAEGNVGIGTSSFNATNPEKLLVDVGTNGTINAISAKGNNPTYVQMNIQNISNSTSASTDIVATNDIGNESSNYIDLGINSSTNNTSGTLGGASTAYLFSTGNDFVIGNGTASKNLTFFSTNASGQTTEKMRLNSLGVTFSQPIKTVASTYTFTIDDYTILVNNTSNITVNLPTASSVPGRCFSVKKISKNNSTVTLNPYASELIDSGLTITMSTANQGWLVQSDGVAWWIINR